MSFPSGKAPQGEKRTTTCSRFGILARTMEIIAFQLAQRHDIDF